MSCSILTSLFLFGLVLPTQESPSPGSGVATKAVLSEGVVTGRDVYVRSGPSLNHYEVCKLQASDKVSVVAMDGDWYEILPPEGTFSLIAGEYVDAKDKQGIVNGNNVRVRAGSLLNSNKYTIQTMLTKGAEVTILGSNPDGFLKITPPTGATVWINKQFVKTNTSIPGDSAPSVAGSVNTIPQDSAMAEDGGKAEPAAIPAITEAVRVADVARTTTKELEVTRPSVERPAPKPPTKEIVEIAPVALPETLNNESRRVLLALDEAARAELVKPVSDRAWEPLIAQYQEVADNAGDEVSRVYANHRLVQLVDLKSVTETIRGLKTLDDKSIDIRQQGLSERNQIHPPFVPAGPTGIDAEGELKVSVVYPVGTFPRRYRLLDHKSPTAKTIGYVEIPPDSSIDVSVYLNRHVGVRASDKHLLPGGVTPVPVFVAKELIVMQPGSLETRGESANAITIITK